MNRIFKYLSFEALFILLQLILSVLFIKIFISKFGIASYGTLISCVASLSICTFLDWPIEIRLSQKINSASSNYNLNPIIYGKIIIVTIFVLILTIITSYAHLILIYSYTFILCQYFTTSIQTILNIYQKSYAASLLHIIIPVIHVLSIITVIYIDGTIQNFYLCATLCFSFIIILSVIYLFHRKFIRPRLIYTRKNLYNYYLRYWFVNYKIIFMRLRFIFKQNTPLILINNIFGSEIAGIYGVIIRLTVIANAVTSKFVSINLPILLQGDQKDSVMKGSKLLSQIKKITCVILLIGLPSSYILIDDILLYFTTDWVENQQKSIFLILIINTCSIISMLNIFLFVIPNFAKLMRLLLVLDCLYLVSFPIIYFLSLEPLLGILACSSLILLIEYGALLISARRWVFRHSV